MYIADASTLIDNTLKKIVESENGHPTLSELKLESLVSEVAGLLFRKNTGHEAFGCLIEEEDFDDYAEEFEEHLVNVLEYRLPQVGEKTLT